MSRVSQPNDNTPVQTSSSSPQLCANNCGFFGSAERNNYCSKCFALVKKQSENKDNAVPATPLTPPTQPPASPVPSQPSASTAPISLDSLSSSPAAPSGTPSKKNRCFQCSRKVGILGFECRCNNVFCGEHRYTYTHNCPFDVKALAANNLSKANPKLESAKLDKI